MSDIQLPDYPWEHPHESDYEEARAMSKPALTDKTDLHAWLMKASRVIYVATDKTTADNISDGLLKAAARIAELEFQRDSQKNRADANEKSWLEHATRVAELEAELSAQQQTAANLAAYTDRIAELEAGWDKWHGDAVTQMRLRVEAEAELEGVTARWQDCYDSRNVEIAQHEKSRARIMELEAERDKLTIANVDLAISTGKRRAELEQNVKTLSAGIDHLAGQLEKAEEERDKLTKELAFLKPLTVKPDDTDGYLVERKAYRELEAERDEYKRLWMATRGK